MVHNDMFNFFRDQTQTLAVRNALFVFKTRQRWNPPTFYLSVQRYDSPTEPGRTKKSELRSIDLPLAFSTGRVYRLALYRKRYVIITCQNKAKQLDSVSNVLTNLPDMNEGHP